MMWGRGAVRAVAAALAVAVGSVPAVALAPGLQASAAIEPGQWLVREHGARTGGRQICLHDVAALIQMRHAGARCSRFVIENQAAQATVHYTCPGAGHGRTTVIVQTSHALTVETQGIADGLPFQQEYRAHRIGNCKGGNR